MSVSLLLLLLAQLASAQVPSAWTSTYQLNLSTIVQPCNYSGFYDVEIIKKAAIVDYDWSNAKQIWANEKPMNCQELLIQQVSMTKAANPNARVFVYRNLVKALPWYTDVRVKISDPAYAGWFLPFSGKNNYHVPACDNNYDPPLCSDLYHDQDQTPNHPHGDGSCVDACDCGGVPCGEYLWDHRNASLREYLVQQFILGPDGLGNTNVSGFYLDDGWANTSQSIAPWMPKEGFCDHSAVGGATEENLYCTADMGLTQADTTAITDAWKETMKAVQAAILSKGAFAWAYFDQQTLPAASDGPASCAAWFRGTGKQLRDRAFVLQYTNATERPLPAVAQDIAAFQVLRGPYAWIGYGWIGCINSYEFPPELDLDYGTPVAITYNETSTGVFVREYTRSVATFDCNNWSGTITMKM